MPTPTPPPSARCLASRVCRHRRRGWQRSQVVALFDTEAQAREAAGLLAVQDFMADAAVVGVRPVADTDWVRLTQSQFEPVAITPDFWIVPTWHEPPAAARTVLRLDPGLAFGTGTHPTTRMCLRWIAAHPPRGRRVLGLWLRLGDSGHGGSAVWRAGGGCGRHRPRGRGSHPAQTLPPMVCGCRPGLPERAQGTYDVVLANILATPLKVLAPLLCAHVAPGGQLVLAGILERQAEELRAAYAPWLALQVQEADEGWILMTAQRPGANAAIIRGMSFITRCPSCGTAFKVVGGSAQNR
jgi:ribosomal protein L11 methyltransferase